MNPSRARLLVKIGLGLQLVRLGLVGISTFKMTQVFDRLTVFGTGSTDELGRGITEALHYGGAALMFGVIGLALLLWGILSARLRERWAWWGGIITGATWLALYPIGTVIGVGAIAAVIWNGARREAVG